MTAPISEELANSIINMPKRIEERMKWKEKPHGSGIFTFEVQIENTEAHNLVLYCTYNTKLNRFSFTVSYNKINRIRGLDIGKEHINPPPKRERIGKKHKHRWTDKHQDRWAYEPDDITTGAPIKQVFQEFLRECNITCQQQLPALPPKQTELFNDDEM